MRIPSPQVPPLAPVAMAGGDIQQSAPAPLSEPGDIYVLADAAPGASDAAVSHPIALPANRSPRAVADHLAALHARDVARVREAFGSTPSVARNKRVIISTVSSPEADFLADYLDVPRENILKVQAHRARRPHTAASQGHTRREVEDFLSRRQLDDGAITLLGHMRFTFDNTPLLGGLSSHAIVSFVGETALRHLNFFSCNSAEIASEVCERFCGDARTTPTMAFFTSEVSPYPATVRKHNPIRFFYAGPEVGPSTRTLNMEVHSHIFRTLQVMPPSATPWSRQSAT